MTQPNPPGLTGPQGTPQPLRRAPKAWAGMLHQVFVEAPAQLQRSQRARRAFLRVKHGK